MRLFPESHDKQLVELLQKVHSGVLQLPEFQRNWTWDNERIKKIISSIAQGYPMGAIMGLTYGNPDIKFKYRPITGAPADGVQPENLILDGQQRLTSLYQSLFSKSVVHTSTDKGKPIDRFYYLSIPDCILETADLDDAVFDVPEDRKIKSNFNRDVSLDLSSRDLEYKNKMFPVNIIFDQSEIMNWVLGYIDYYDRADKEVEEIKRFQSEIISTFTGYKLPVIQLDKDTPREAVCRVFENVNTGGVALTVFELVTATFASDGFDLREDWDENCKGVIRADGESLRSDIFDDIDETSFLTTITLYTSFINKMEGLTGSVSCKKKDVLSLKLEDYKANKDTVLNGYKIARNFLVKDQHVFRRRDLPYSTQVIPLTAVCAYLGESKCGLPSVIDKLSEWYWCGIFGEMYGGANETRYANDIEDLVAYIDGNETLNRTINASFFSSPRLLTLQTRLSAAYKGLMALIYKADCKDFITGDTMTLVNSLEGSPDIHHIFPEAYCQRCAIDRRRYNSIVNKTPILPKTNRTIGGKAPSIYIKKILSNDDNRINRTELETNISSHCVNFNLLATDGFDEYFIDRAKRLLDLIEAATGKKIADRSSEITINEFGSSLEW